MPWKRTAVTGTPALRSLLAYASPSSRNAQRQGLDLRTFRTVVDSGQLGSGITRVKVPMLAAHDFTVQAATSDGYASTRLIADAARAAGIATPLLDLSSELYAESVRLGNGRLDMSSVLTAIEARTDRTTGTTGRGGGFGAVNEGEGTAP
ncbi:NAD-binding protein [Streptomyces sp. NBC_00631]|uniref:NAD-binding protein n=1 Tax=Streptomyces sp. NBC_00631 TaxID=2975793 RepID=UPI0030E402D2